MAYNYIGINWFYVAFHFVSRYHDMLSYEMDDQYYYTDQCLSVM